MIIFLITIHSYKMKKTCNICADTKNQSEIIACNICDYECCKKCMKQYISSSSKDKINCMNDKCRVLFTRKTLIDLIGITYISKEYRSIVNKVRIDKQTSLLSTFQETARIELELEKEKKELIELEQAIKDKKNNIALLKNNLLALSNNTQKVKKNFIRPCSDGDCKGFLNTNYKCELCSKITCKDCFDVITTEDHVCNPDSKATADMLKKDTKCCPSCGNGIYKIDGCDQMWCSLCNTAFSWKTGIIEKGRIHNPHYYDFLRRQGNGDIPREEDVIQRFINNNNHCRRINDIILRTCTGIHRDNLNLAIRNVAKYLMDCIRYYDHVRHLTIEYNGYIINFDEKIKRSNIDYLKNVLNKEGYHKKIIYYENKKEIYQEKQMILDTLNNTINDIFITYYDANISSLNFTNLDKIKCETIKFNKIFTDFINYCINEDCYTSELYNSKSRLMLNNYPIYLL